jgi:drug/metabolite transporter (DMT)-like permease
MLFGFALRRVAPDRALVLLQVQSLTALAVGVLLLHETLSLPQSLGVALVVASAVLGRRRAALRSALPRGRGIERIG